MKYSRLILFTLFAVIITDILRYIGMSGTISIDSATYVSTLFFYSSILILLNFAYKEGFSKSRVPQMIKLLLLSWIGWSILSLIRGSLYAVDYWDWKAILTNSLAYSFIPLTFFIGLNLQIAKSIFRFTYRYIYVLGFILIPFAFITNKELYSRIMASIGLFLVFLPFLKTRLKLLVIIVAVVSIIVVPAFRSNIIKIVFSSGLLIIYLLRNYLTRGWLLLGHFLLFITPIVLFVLAITGQYNLFKDISGDEGYYIEGSRELQVNYRADTRTGLYRDVLTSLSQSGNWIIGEGAGGKYQTERFDNLGDGRGRYGSEVGILNILLYNGIVGVALYFILLYTTSYIAIRRSNNILVQLLGLFIAFRWLFSFVEEFTQYDMNFYFFWIAMGLVANRNFREMNDDDIRNFFELKA